MCRRVLLLVLVMVLVDTSGYAQSDRPTPNSFRLEWSRRPGWMRPGTDGFIYNESRWRVTNVRVQARAVDGSGRLVRETVVSVFGNSVPGVRTFFSLPPIAEGESYQLEVVSFDLISREGPAREESPEGGGPLTGFRRRYCRRLLVVAVPLAAAGVAGARDVRLSERGLWSAVVPASLLSPLRTPLVAPVRRRLALPLLPVSRRHVVVAHWHCQDWSRNELRRDENPRAVMTAAHVPARGSEHPILSAVEENITRCARRVTHRRDARNHHEGRRRRQAEADVHVNLGVGRPGQDQAKQGDGRIVNEHVNPPPLRIGLS